jgi:hypothetical protein
VNLDHARALADRHDYHPTLNAVDAEAEATLKRYRQAKARVASLLLRDLRHQRSLSQASVEIKRARHGTVNPEWEGLSYLDKQAEVDYFTALITLIESGLTDDN